MSHVWRLLFSERTNLFKLICHVLIGIYLGGFQVGQGQYYGFIVWFSLIAFEGR